MTTVAVDNAAHAEGSRVHIDLGCPAMGVAVAKHALLVRVDNSPYAAAGRGVPYVSEFWGPSVYEMNNFSTVLGSRAVSMVPFHVYELLLSGLAAYKTCRRPVWVPGGSRNVAITP